MKGSKSALAAIGLGALMMGAPALAGPIQLGFTLDESGSVGLTDFDLAKNALGNALANVPIDGSVELTVTTFNTSQTTVVAPTLIDSQAALDGVVAAVIATTFSGGGTNIAGAITDLSALIQGSPNFVAGEKQVINITTDGQSSVPAAVAASEAALAAGIDFLSAEGVGGGVDIPDLIDIVNPNDAFMLADADVLVDLAGGETLVPDQPFVIPVSDFTAFESAIAAKVTALATTPDPDPTPVPVPAPALLLGLGLLALGALRRRAL